jgi:hypothetical protein
VGKQFAVSCGDESEPDGVVCPGTVRFGPRDPQGACDTCGGWYGRYAPVVELKHAAVLMRDRASAANTDEARRPYGDKRCEPVTVDRWGALVDNYLGEEVGAHCAAWTPAAAVAVADWLDLMANPWIEGQRGPALAVARAYLIGEDAYLVGEDGNG